MPIAALPPNSTDRWWLDYTVNGDAHSMLMRAGSTKTAAEVSSVFSDFLTLFTINNLYEVNVVGMRHALNGSDVSLPATYTGDTQLGSGTANTTDMRAKTISFTGRDQTGHKIKLYMFGVKFQSNGDYRIQRGEDVAVGDLLNYLAALDGFFDSINGLHPIWNQYANVGFNDHWIKRVRG